MKNATNGSKENQENAHPLRARFQRRDTTNADCRPLEFWKNVDEISETFGIGRNVFARRSVCLEKQIPNKDRN
jgi:hypothetical protein